MPCAQCLQRWIQRIFTSIGTMVACVMQHVARIQIKILKSQWCSRCIVHWIMFWYVSEFVPRWTRWTRYNARLCERSTRIQSTLLSRKLRRWWWRPTEIPDKCIYMWVMAHMNASVYTYGWGTPSCRMRRRWWWRPAHTDFHQPQWHTHEWVMSHVWMSHDTVMAHISMSHDTQKN